MSVVREAAKDLREVASVKVEDHGVHPLNRYAYRPHLQGGSVTMDVAGRYLYALLPTHERMVKVDASSLSIVAQSEICKRPEQVVVAPDGRSFVTCRGEDKVVALDADGAVTHSVAIAGEPFGIALAPQLNRIVVTSATGAKAYGLSTRDLSTLWSRALPPDPRGVAISADGKRATVAHLRSEGVSIVDVSSGATGRVALPNRRDGWPSELWDATDLPTDTRRAGGAFAVASSPGGTRAFVPYLLRNDGSKVEEFLPGCYAGGTDLPIAASVAAVDLASGAVQRPRLKELPPDKQTSTIAGLDHVSYLGRLGVVRAAFHDPAKSRLFAVGEGSKILAAFSTATPPIPPPHPSGFGPCRAWPPASSSIPKANGSSRTSTMSWR